MSRLMNLPEYDVLIYSMDRTPCADPAFKCAADASSEFRVALAKFPKNANRPQSRCALQHGNNFFYEYPGQWIRSTALVFDLLLAR